jgi:hypothetical protein
MRKPATRSHRAAACTALVGCVVVAIGAVQPWLIVRGPDISVGIKDVVDFKPNTTAQLDSATEGMTRVILTAAAIGVVLCLVLAGVRRWSGVLLRLPLFVGGAATAWLGGSLIYYANTALDHGSGGEGGVAGAFHAVLDGVQRTLVSVSPGIGAYALAGGGVVVAIGALFPSRDIAPRYIMLPRDDGQLPPPPIAQKSADGHRHAR